SDVCSSDLGDYQQPLEIPIPNWLALRSLTQTLAKRAECHLLMARPDKALDELTLISDLCHFLESGKPMSLVAAMSEAAVIELYARTVAEGLRLHVWREPQLTAI